VHSTATIWVDVRFGLKAILYTAQCIQKLGGPYLTLETRENNLKTFVSKQGNNFTNF
jgi:hypothetical protein